MIAMLLTTQNEADILRLNIEHHLSWGVDHIFVADNASTDDTRDVIASFGTSVSTKVFSDTKKRHRVRMEGLEALKRRHKVDWAGVSDTDEFRLLSMGRKGRCTFGRCTGLRRTTARCI
jgi:glycosyltransferase involved in cell wall biosynthesis